MCVVSKIDLTSKNLDSSGGNKEIIVIIQDLMLKYHTISCVMITNSVIALISSAVEDSN